MQAGMWLQFLQIEFKNRIQAEYYRVSMFRKQSLLTRPRSFNISLQEELWASLTNISSEHKQQMPQLNIPELCSGLWFELWDTHLE